MAKKPHPPAQTDKQDTVSGTGVVMRDESDEIIDSLKRQLETLQRQLADYRSGGSGTSPPAAPPESGQRDALLEEWAAGFTPYLASHLRIPAEDLTLRLGRAIDQVADPALRRELEHCRDTAALLLGTFRRIQDNHRLLTDSLSAEKMDVPADAFCGQVESALRERGFEAPRIAGAGAGGTLRVAAGAACAVVVTLAELVSTLFGPPVLTRVDLSGVESAGVFRLQIATPRPWQGVEGEEVAALAFRSGVRAHSIVDLLYVEKIAELQGASVRYLRENGTVHGLEVTWPSR
jgi:hypothetical protein